MSNLKFLENTPAQS